MEAISDFYSELRSASQDNSLPVTVRCLETIIRLSTAAAKARLAEGDYNHLPGEDGAGGGEWGAGPLCEPRSLSMGRVHAFEHECQACASKITSIWDALASQTSESNCRKEPHITLFRFLIHKKQGLNTSNYRPGI